MQTSQPGLAPIQWRKEPGFDARNRVLVTVDVRKLDNAWKREGVGLYIPSGGGGGEIAGRRAAFSEYLKSGKPVNTPVVNVQKDGSVRFANGRHRFSVLRDMGYHRVAVSVPRSQAARLRAL